MNQRRVLLICLAVVGWTGTFISQVAAIRADERETKLGWKERRNQFLLLSSLTTNTLVFATLYRFGKQLRQRIRRT